MQFPLARLLSRSLSLSLPLPPPPPLSLFLSLLLGPFSLFSLSLSRYLRILSCLRLFLSPSLPLSRRSASLTLFLIVSLSLFADSLRLRSPLLTYLNETRPRQCEYGILPVFDADAAVSRRSDSPHARLEIERRATTPASILQSLTLIDRPRSHPTAPTLHSTRKIRS